MVVGVDDGRGAHPGHRPGAATTALLQGVSRTYTVGAGTVTALRDVNVEIDAGEFVVVLGPSGSGKSTLLNIIGALDAPTSGTVTVAGRTVTGASRTELAALRREVVASRGLGGSFGRRGSTSSLVQIPEKSGLPSAVRGVGADISTVPSALRGAPAIG